MGLNYCYYDENFAILSQNNYCNYTVCECD